MNEIVLYTLINLIICRLAGLKVQLKEKKCALTDKCDTLELLTADIDDVLNAIKGAVLNMT